MSDARNNHSSCANCRRCVHWKQPTVVDVTDAFLLLGESSPKEEDDNISMTENTSSSSRAQQQQKERLRYNLQTYGWSPLLLQTSQIVLRSESNTGDADASASSLLSFRARQLLQQHACWKSMIQELFASVDANEGNDDAETTMTNNNSGYYQFTLRTRESGGTSGSIEPKLSWEIQRVAAPSDNNDETTLSLKSSSSSQQRLRQERLQDWMQILHQTAVAARHLLGLPSHVLLHEEENNVVTSENNNNRCVDLMRAFYYDAAAAAAAAAPAAACRQDNDDKEPPPPPLEGSSPHTDWGSFTIVWQDLVGGLQTYCPECHGWNDVPTVWNNGHPQETTTVTDDGSIYMVIHVGDITSIAMRRALMATTTTPNKSSSNHHHHLPWPSPRHRVVLASEKRVSLVYFAYPPAHVSLQEIQDQLIKVIAAEEESGPNNGMMVDPPKEQLQVAEETENDEEWYQEYSVLQNQSVVQTVVVDNECEADEQPAAQSRLAKNQYDRICNLPLGTVLQEKWQQVQRG